MAVIFLNGTSSSGKSSIAETLCKMAGYSYFSLDSFLEESYSYPQRVMMALDQTERCLDYAVSAFHRYIAAIDTRANIVVDTVLRKEPWGRECGELLAEHSVILVGVFCPLDELIRREKLRLDRLKGTAALQFDSVHRNKEYDLVVDTMQLTPNECAQRIVSYANAQVPEINAAQTRHKFFTG